VHPVCTNDRAHHTLPFSVVVIIPARYQSTRFPGKPLAELDGRPMIEHVYRRATEAPNIERVIVATDDERVADAVRAFGGTVAMTRADHRSGTDRIAEVAQGLACDVVVNLQGDEPLVHPSTIAALIGPMESDPTIQMTTVCRPLEADDLDDPNVVKVVVDLDGCALYFSRAPVPYGRSRDGHFVPTCSFKHLGLYAYRREFLLRLAALAPTPLELAESLEQLRALEHGVRIKVVQTAHDSTGVDTPADLDRVRRRLTGAER